jgi:hypothetical protein
MRFILSFSLIFLLLTVYCSSAFAGSTRVTSGFVSLAASQFKYEEYGADGKQLLTEKGFLPGILTGLDFNKAGWFLKGEVGYYNGEVDYTGQTNTGMPIATTTDEEILKASIRVGRWLIQSDGWRLGLLGGFGLRWWWRDIRSVGQVNGLSETYTTKFWLLGARFEQAFSERITVSLRGELIIPIDLEVEVSLKNRDDISLEIEEKIGYRVGAALGWRWTESMQIVLRPSYTFWKFGKSATQPLTWNGIPVGTVYEPDSETRISTLELTIVHTF